MIENKNSEIGSAPGLAARIARNGIGVLRNRAELFSLECQEERSRLLELLLWGMGLIALATMAAMLVTITIIFLVPAQFRLVAAAGFSILYFAGAFAALAILKGLLREEPFQETTRQIKLDRAWLESLR
jgi:uncharacterized membrane protein YqjE